MTGKHTPGPWRIGNLESYDMEGTPFRRVYFNMKSDDIAEAHIRGDSCDDNARLIAAAPDLLNACKAFEKYDVTDVDDGVEMMLRYAHARELMISAIHKAEGRA